MEILEEFESLDSYIFIKPNEDVLAFHNGKYKLNYNFITNFHLNQGGSYSSSYLLQSIAIEKYLQQNYQQTLVMGLSQGGLATLINALESQPDFAVIASGYSVLSGKIEWSGHDQIIVPGISRRINEDSILQEFGDSKTKWLFTYGFEEQGIYKMEAQEMLTASAVEGLPNVEVEIHEKGHLFPVEEIRGFIKKKLK